MLVILMCILLKEKQMDENRILINFPTDVWDTIKGFVGIKPDFPVEILEFLKETTHRNTLVALLENAINRFLDRLKGPHIHIFNHGYNMIYEKIVSMADKKEVLRTFWKYKHPDVFYYIAYEVIKKKRFLERKKARQHTYCRYTLDVVAFRKEVNRERKDYISKVQFQY
jgi:hypothetical protein